MTDQDQGDEGPSPEQVPPDPSTPPNSPGHAGAQSVEGRRRTRWRRRRLRDHPLAAPVAVVAMVLVGLTLGFLAGYSQMPPDDPTVSRTHYDGACPRSASTKSVYTVTVAGTQQIEVKSSLTIKMTGVRPYHAPFDQELGTPDMERNLARCFIRADDDDSEVKDLQWRDGVFEIDIEFPGSTSQADLNGGLVTVEPGTDHSTVWIDPCRPLESDSSRAENTICRVDTDNSIVLDIKRPLSPVMTSPFPVQQDPSDDGVQSTWHFAGSPPPIKADLLVPADMAAKSWIAWNGSVYYLNSINENLTVDLVYLANNWDTILCLAVVVLVLVRLHGPWPGRRRCRAWLRSIVVDGTTYLCLAGAVLLLAFQVDALGALYAVYGGYEAFYDRSWPIASVVIVVPAWVLLGVAFGSGRQRVALVVLALLALAPVLTVAYVLPEARLPQAATIWLAVFCVAFVALLLTAGAAMWRPVSEAFTGSRERYPRTASMIVRGVAAVLVIVTFALAITFPVGSLCNCGPPGWAKIPRAAAELVWNMGYQFSGVIAQVVILLVVVNLAARLLLESERVSVRRLIPLAALLLTLAAPWNSSMSMVEVVSLPLWLLQFWVLWAALSLIVNSASSAPSVPEPGSSRPELLKAALELADDDSSRVATRRDDVTRFLNLGPADGRVSNAHEAAKIGALLAVIPVGIVIWTAVVQVGEKLQQFNGLFLVVTLAVVELARWVFSAMLYGLFHRDLPGKTGAVKALWFTGIWIISCFVPLMVAQAAGHQLVGETVYRSAQLGVFTLVLAVAFDYLTVVTGEGDFAALKRLYNRQSLTDALPTIITGLGLAVVLFKQLLAGSGFDAVSSLLDGLGNILPLGGRHL